MSEYNKIYVKSPFYIARTTNQLIEAGKYLVPTMHLNQLKTRVIIFQEVTAFVMKRASCITSIMHAGKHYYGTQFFCGKFTPRFSTSLTRPPQ
jgi:hypothetical protein